MYIPRKCVIDLLTAKLGLLISWREELVGDKIIYTLSRIFCVKHWEYIEDEIISSDSVTHILDFIEPTWRGYYDQSTQEFGSKYLQQLRDKRRNKKAS